MAAADAVPIVLVATLKKVTEVKLISAFHFNHCILMIIISTCYQYKSYS